MNGSKYSEKILRELQGTLSQIDDTQAENLAERILASGKILVAGAGRSGFAVKAFAMRLMHMGFDAYVVGETVTPNLEPEDLLLIGSGSGETGSLVTMATKAKALHGKLALVTIFPESSIGKLADITVRIPAPTPKAKADNGLTSIQPMGSLFEQSLFLFLDTLILKLMEKKSKDSDTMFKRHANLE
ncbi:6-phospho-3-hexuloisomerase [Brenneria roseae subsp. americana]|uniref:6-phospho-3-hexuloisomerase n=1 Tax=Brenneria roseae subsp. americana TaxID=1508507 RepID=A0A2U1TNW1_9GAMM|nr:6-phospho-3-hexuloisomerase [Brenneria roseae]PWC11096.1 6-phospho-3-hexuloisomerase [Brenneria roseae subsp. americana]